MSTGFIVNEKNELEEIAQQDRPQQPATVRTIAKIISYIFHPVFVPVYVILFLLYVHPYLFAGTSDMNKGLTVVRAFLMYTFFPVVGTLLLKALDFIPSIHLKTQKDRIIPLVMCGVWYFWVYFTWRNLPEYSPQVVKLNLAIWISVSLALLANIVMKISLHTISMGVMLAFIFLLAFSEPLNYGLYIAVVLLITGLVCTARFIDSDHSSKEIYGGLLLGIGSMLIAWSVG